MNEIHTSKGFKRECPPDGMIHGLIWIGFDPFLNHVRVHVISIFCFLYVAISNHMFVHDNSGIGSSLSVCDHRDLRPFMDRGADFGGKTAGEVQGDNQHGEEENWIHFG